MKIKILSICTLFCFITKAKAQLVLNFQFGQSASYSQRTGGDNDKGKVKVSPFFDNTWSLGLGYKIKPKTTLLFSISLNSHSYVVQMKDATSGKYNSGKEGYKFKYQNSRSVYEYKLSVIQAIIQKKKINVNITGGVGVYCPRCTYFGWSGVGPFFVSSTPLFTQPDSYIALYKRNTKNYTFINTFFTIGAELSYKVKSSEFGIFMDFEMALDKNFDHKIEYARNGETGHINIVNRGILLRMGLFLRPFINLKKKTKEPETTSPEQSYCLPCSLNQ
jgi:hypothetical protein